MNKMSLSAENLSQFKIVKIWMVIRFVILQQQQEPQLPQ